MAKPKSNVRAYALKSDDSAKTRSNIQCHLTANNSTVEKKTKVQTL